MSLRGEGSVGVSVIARYEFITKKQITPKPHNMMKTTARNSVFSFLITLSALALSATANAALLNNGAYNGTYGPSTTQVWDPLFNFTFDSGKVYGISANMSLSGVTAANDTAGNYTFLTLGNTNTGGEYGFASGTVGISQNIYNYNGSILFVEPSKGGFAYTGSNNVEIGAPQSLNVGFSLDTTGTTWAVNYYQGGTGFNDTAVYQGGNLIGTSTGITADSLKGIFLSYYPIAATGAEAQSVVSNFRVVDSVPEPSTYALVIGGIATLLLIRRRVQA
jgi:hypothetical protein